MVKRTKNLRNVVAAVAICLAGMTVFTGCDPEDEPIDGTEKPAAVMNLTASAGNAQVVLTWDEPTDNGGSEITAYEVTRDNWANKVTKAANELTHTYTGLTNGTQYTFKVRAVNAKGAGVETSATATPTESGSNPANWTLVTNTTFEGGTGASVNSIAYGNGKFVAVGYKSEYSSTFFHMAYSTDGINWTAVANTGLTTISSYGRAWYNSVNDIAYGNGKFVAVTENNQIAYSTDGINWTASGASGFFPTPNDNGIEYTRIESIVYANGKFVIGGVTGGMPSYTPTWQCGSQMAYSTDGINWTPINTTAFGFDLSYTTQTSNYSVDRLFFGNGIFHATQNSYPDGKMAYSADGVNWTALSNITQARAMAYGNNKFVASLSDTDNKMASSTNGINWTQISANVGRFNCMIFANGKFLATGNSSNNGVWTSTDGITWNHNEVYNSGAYRNAKMAYGGGKLVLVGYKTGNTPVIAYCNY